MNSSDLKIGICDSSDTVYKTNQITFNLLGHP